MSDPQVRSLARRLHALEKARLATKQPTLSFSSIEDGALSSVDVDGNLQMQIGKQYDGTQTSAVLQGPPPPTPSAAIVTEETPAGLTVTWDGTYVDSLVSPMDFSRVTIHATPSAGWTGSFDPQGEHMPVGSISSATGGTLWIPTTPGIEHLIILVAWSQAGKMSGLSVPTAGTATVVGLDTEAPEWIALMEEAAAAKTAAADAQAASAAAAADALAAQQAADAAGDEALAAQTDATAAQTAAANAVGIANGKAIVRIQTATPAVADQNPTTLWIDITGGTNTPKRWTGSAWAAVTDKVAQDAATAAASATTKANTAQAAAEAAGADATTALGAANSKNKVIFSTFAPTNQASTAGDSWFHRHSTTGEVIGLYEGGGNGTWTKRDLSSAVFASIDAGKITFGTMSGERITAGTLVIGQVASLSSTLDSKETPAGAQTKATAAQTAAVSAAATDAQTKANAAQAAAISAAATDAQTKANAAQAAAQAAAAAYVQSRGSNLVTNGTGQLGDATNFPGATYTPSDAPTGAKASFAYPGGSATRQLDELLPVDPSKVYELAYDHRQTAGAGRFYSFLAPYDSYGLSISPTDYMEQANTRTTLAAALKPGDTTVSLTSGANWYNGSGGSHLRTIIFWDYVDQGGKAWAPGTYSRNWTRDAWDAGGVSGNVITLRTPWAGPNKPAGTVVGNGSSGGAYMYIGASNVLGTDVWSHMSGRTAQGIHDAITSAASTKFPPATAQAKVGFLVNYAVSGSPDPASRQSVANVTLTEVTAASDAAAAAAADAQTKANAAEAAAKAAAAADATSKANAAQAAAISAASLDATTKADAAKAAAESAAALTAQAKADQAKADALTGAAVTAQQKADAAAAQAKADATAAAAADATSKANAAQTAAINAAALDATTKANAAQNNAVSQAVGAGFLNSNPTWAAWTSTYPTGVAAGTGAAPTKETVVVRTSPNGMRFNDTTAATHTVSLSGTLTGVPFSDYLVVEAEVYLTSGNFSGAGIYVDWTGSTAPIRSLLRFDAAGTAPATGKWYRFTKTLKRPTAGGTHNAWTAFLASNLTDFGALSVKNIVVDRVGFRPATTEEITAFESPSNIAAAQATAIATASSDATSKANAAQTAAISAAATDAQSKADAARTAAEAAAATTAQAKADAAKAAAIASASSDATTKADAAKAQALADAAVTAQQKADAAYASAQTDATTKSDAAKAAAIAQAATDATAAYGETKTLVSGWKVTGKTTIAGGQIETDSILAAAIKSDNIETRHIAAGAVQAEEINSGSVATAVLSAGVIQSGFALLGKLQVGENITISPDTGITINLTDDQGGVIHFPADGSAATITADLDATSLLVRGSLDIRGSNNYLAGTMKLAAGIIDPQVAPTVTSDYPYIQIPVDSTSQEWQAITDFIGADGVTYDGYVIADTADNLYHLSALGVRTPIAMASGTTLKRAANDYIIDMTSDRGASGVGRYAVLLKNGSTGVFYIKTLNAGWAQMSDVTVTLGVTGDFAPVIGGLVANQSTMYIARQYASDNVPRVRKININTGAAIGSTYTLAAPTGGWGYDDVLRSLDLRQPIGSSFTRLLLLIDSYGKGASFSGWRVWENATGSSAARLTAEEWPQVPGIEAWSGTANGSGSYEYVTLARFDNRIYRYSTSPQRTEIYGFTWWDKDPAGTYGMGESRVSPPSTSKTILKGAFARVNTSAIPDGGSPDDPNAVRLYCKYNGSSTWKLVSAPPYNPEPVEGQTLFWIYSGNGGTSDVPPATSAFEGRVGANGKLSSSGVNVAGGTSWELSGTGSGRMGPMEWDAGGRITVGAERPGTLIFWPGTVVPADTLVCNGAAVSRSTYAALFAAIGTTWGVGDGSTTFNLPNFSNRVPRMTTPGAYGGSDTVTMPDHTHSIPAHDHPVGAVTLSKQTRAQGSQSPSVVTDISGRTGNSTSEQSGTVTGTNPAISNVPSYAGISVLIKF